MIEANSCLDVAAEFKAGPTGPPLGTLKATLHPSPPAIVFVVDSDPTVSASLAPLLRGAGWEPTFFRSGEEFLARPRSFCPSCMILGAALQGMSALVLQKLIADRTEVPIIFVGCERDFTTAVQAMKAGAVDFLTRPPATDALTRAVAQAVECSRVTLIQETYVRYLRRCYLSLTRRERDVMERVVAGRMNKQTAGELGISEKTVKWHRGMAMKKMGANSLAQLVSMAARLGLDNPSEAERLAPQQSE